ncbi:hypothetical protein AYO49_06345, partial [Verrucomicrobiaceae bacterium SCGC AG-212-N21]
MKWLRASSASSSPKQADAGAPKMDAAQALKAAHTAKEQDDWPAALLALDQADKKARDSAEYHQVRGWALERAGRLEEAHAALRKAAAATPQDAALKAASDDLKRRLRAATPVSDGDEHRGLQRLRFDGSALEASPYELALLTEVLQELKPATVFEAGTRGGGLARWFSAITAGMGIPTQVESADWMQLAASEKTTLAFRSGDLRKPGSIWQGSALKRLTHPWLIVLRPGGGFEVAWSSLRAWHKWVSGGDVICLFADGGSAGDVARKETAQDALARFIGRNPVEYESLTKYATWFGEGSTLTNLRCVRRTALNALDDAASPGLEAIRKKMEAGEWRAALEELNAIKATRTARRGADYLRSLCFLELNDSFSACEAAKEELRFFPGHAHAQAVVTAMLAQMFPGTPKLGGAEFHEIYRTVRPYTMLSDERLYSLYLRTRLVCQMDIPGDLVECGVAAGGGSALIAATMARHTKRPRKLYSCDTFEGMPVPTAKDVAWGVEAEASGWGSGTCAAPPGSLLEVCAKLGVEKFVEPVKGFFKDTLPGLKDRLPNGIAFLHMDGDWYESTWDILVSLYEKTQPRGFIQVDDYGHWEGCRQAMWDYAKQHGFEFK